MQIPGKNNKKSPGDSNTKDVEITVPLKYLRNFGKTLEMPWFNCKINLIQPGQ